MTPAIKLVSTTPMSIPLINGNISMVPEVKKKLQLSSYKSPSIAPALSPVVKVVILAQRVKIVA